MGLIQGITIQLDEPDGTAVSVENVLVTPSAIAEDPQAEWNLGSLRPDYTLAIPKDDANTWEGARAEFFDATWEIVAVSGMTIPHLTPLSWNMRAYAVREMADTLTLRTVRTRTRGEHGIYTDSYKEVEVSALLHPVTAAGEYVGQSSGKRIDMRVLVRQEDFDAAGTEEREPQQAEAGGVTYALEGYERIGSIVMLLDLVREA